MSQPLLSASQILDAEDLAEEVVPVPEWGGNVRLCQMNSEESFAFSKALTASASSEDGIYLILIYSARDAERQMVLRTEDVPALRKKNQDVLIRLQTVALRLNKMGVAGKEALKKDSSEAATVASPTPLPVV